MNLTEGAIFGTVLKHTLSVAKKHWKILVMFGLLSRVISQGIQRYLDSVIGIGEILTALEKSIESKLPEILTRISSNTPLGIEDIGLLYGDAWNIIEPHMPLLTGLYFITFVVGIGIYMWIVQLTIDEVEQVTQPQGKRLLGVIGQFLPFLSTVILQAIITLFLIGLFILPGIIVGVYWMFTNIIVIHKKIYHREAMKESWRIVKGRWRQTTGISFSLAFTVMAIIFVISISLGSIVGSVTDPVTGFAFTTMGLSILMLTLQILMTVFYMRREKTTLNQSY